METFTMEFINKLKFWDFIEIKLIPKLTLNNSQIARFSNLNVCRNSGYVSGINFLLESLFFKKTDSDAGVFMWRLKNSYEHKFWRISSIGCLCLFSLNYDSGWKSCFVQWKIRKTVFYSVEYLFLKNTSDGYFSRNKKLSQRIHF